VLRELAKIAALILCILSIYALLGSAFFTPAAPWQARLISALETLTIAACVCFASGLLFTLTDQPTANHAEPTVTQTLPVQLFFWSLAATVLLFLLSRYLEVFYIPHIWKNQPW